MGNREPFGIDEYYHCYNRGVDKRRVFLDTQDYERFLALIYLCNSNDSVRIDDLKKSQGFTLRDLCTRERTSTLVDISAYCLMPNHVHLLLRQTTEGGISCFMQKVFTGYTGYFNKKYERSGPLYAGAFKSKHVYNDRYFKQAWSYIHLNPAELVEKRWKEGKGDIPLIEKSLRSYEYFSLPDFSSNDRPHRNILDTQVFSLFERIPTTREMLEDAQAYYQEQNLDKVFKM